MVAIYVLECASGKYYVGSTDNWKTRFKKHFSKEGATKWTRKYKPKRILYYEDDLEKADENRITFEKMKQYGVRNVRGGDYCLVDMSEMSIRKLEVKFGIIKNINMSSSKIKMNQYTPGLDGSDLKECVLSIIRQRDHGDGVAFETILIDGNMRGFSCQDSEAMLDELSEKRVIDEPRFGWFKTQ